MIAFDEAITVLADGVGPLGKEKIPLHEAHGRILAEAIEARIDAPRSDTSAMDGYAVCDRDLSPLPARLPIAVRIFAGDAGGTSLAPGSCARIFTGAPIPDGADRVVIQEIVREQGGKALFEESPGTARHIRRRGSDFKAGDLLLEPGHLLGPRSLVAAAAADVPVVNVWKRPKVRILSTGDELAEPGEARARAGAIPESVSIGVSALAADWGAVVDPPVRLPDNMIVMTKAATQAVECADLVVVTGGASVGEKDFAKSIFETPALDILFSKVAMKPGKPVWMGRAGGTLVLGLPGNPTSALVTARVLLAPLLARLTGRNVERALQWRKAELAGPLDACGSRETFVRARSEGGKAQPLANQDSSAQRTLADADLLIRRRPSTPAASTGDLVEILEF